MPTKYIATEILINISNNSHRGLFEMISFAEYLKESKVVHPRDTVETEHKVGDEVVVNSSPWSVKTAKVKRIGRTMIHVTHNDGSPDGAYATKHVHKTAESALKVKD